MAAPQSPKEEKGEALRLALPKGHMQEGVIKLLGDAGIQVSISARGYRPTISLPNVDVKLLKPQNILEMLDMGSRDIGFGGLDWVENLGIQLVELLDTGLDPVQIVAAAPSHALVEDAKKSGKQIVIASEYEKLTQNWIKAKGLNAKFVRSFGATESFPPEDADMIVDNTATGSTLQANGLHIVDTLLKSSTRLYASKKALENPAKKKQIDELVLLLKSVLAGREHSMVEFNLATDKYEQAIGKIPALRAPTVAKLHNDNGYAVKIAVQKKKLPQLLPQLKEFGACDIVVSQLSQLIV